jgi:hypothetical protein
MALGALARKGLIEVAHTDPPAWADLRHRCRVLLDVECPLADIDHGIAPIGVPEVSTPAPTLRAAGTGGLFDRFLQECVVSSRGGGSRIQSSELYRVFLAWQHAAGDEDGPTWTNTAFSLEMKRRGYQHLKSSVKWWIRIKLTAAVREFYGSGPVPGRVDGERRHKNTVGAQTADDAPPQPATLQTDENIGQQSEAPPKPSQPSQNGRRKRTAKVLK